MSGRLVKAFAGLAILLSPAFALNTGDLTVAAKPGEMDVKVTANGSNKVLAEIIGISFGSTSYATISSVQETPTSMTLVLANDVTLTISRTSSNAVRFFGNKANAGKARITLKDNTSEHFFGITEQNFDGNSPDLRGKQVRCEPMYYDQNENFAQAWSAFYFSSLGYAGFFDSFAEGTYSFGIDGKTVITHETDSLDWYLIYGPKGDRIHQTYFSIIGAPLNVPIWALGPVIWRDNFKGSTDVLSYATKTAENRIPVTALWIDRPYSDGESGWTEMNFSAKFQNPEVWLKQTLIADNNIQVMTWVAPATFGATVPVSLLSTNSHAYIDLSKPSNVQWYTERLTTRQYPYGVRGHKMDRVDQSFPIDALWYDSTPTPKKRAKFIYLNAKVTHDALKATYGEDKFNFPRAAYHRTQQWNNAIWGGDSKPSWPGLTGSVANSIRANFMGFPMWGSDIGGYIVTSQIPEEEHLRWLGFGVFSGFMEHKYDGREPWLYNAEFISNLKSYYDLRMDLLPMVYSMANNSAEDGCMMKSLPMMYPDDANTYSISDQYLFGKSMLVAPILTATGSRSAYFPAGKWYSFWDYSKVQVGGVTAVVSSPVNQIPVFIKANSIYPTGQIYPGNMKKWVSDFDASRNIAINAFPGADGESETFQYLDYTDGNRKKTLSVAAGPNNGVLVTAPAMKIPGKVMVRMDVAPTSVRLNGSLLAVSQYTYNAQTKKLEVPIRASVATTLSINGLTVGTKSRLRAPMLTSRFAVQRSASGFDLVVPAISGSRPGDRFSVSVYNLQGEQVVKSTREPMLSKPSLVPISGLGKGVYMVSLDVEGTVIARQKISVPAIP